MPMPMPPGKRLAVPPMHPDINAAARAKVHALVNRRLFGEAWDLAVDLEVHRRRTAGRAEATNRTEATYEQQRIAA